MNKSKSVNNVYKFKTLYKKTKYGKIQYWKIKVEKKDDDGIIIIERGLMGGKITITNKTIDKGKNIGKKNETSPYEQAILNAKSDFNNKKKKTGYKEEQNEVIQDCVKSIIKVKPMLAKNYLKEILKNSKQGIIFPCYVQLKIDGIRCTTNKELMQSRTNTIYKLFENIHNECKELLNDYDNNIYLDGELYTSTLEFKDLSGLINRKTYHPDMEKIKYYIFDMIDLNNKDLSFEARHNIIKSHLTSKKYKKLKLVTCKIMKNKDEIEGHLDKSINSGYEGIMLRNIKSKYGIDKRSYDLQKCKRFFDEEFKIIGYNEGTAKFKGTVIWICKTNNNKHEFKVTPEGTLKYRSELFKSADEYINKELTVKYQEKDKNGKPRFGIGRFR
jgi:ATP-dependent DNA ligase